MSDDQVSPEEPWDPGSQRTRRPLLRLPAGRGQRVGVVLGAAVTAIALGGVIGLATRGGPTGPVTTPAPVALASAEPSRAIPSAMAPLVPPSAPPTSTTEPEMGDMRGTTTWALPAGWRYDLVCEDMPCTLHLLDDAGREQDGWPVAIAGDCLGRAVIGPHESAFVACTRNTSTVITALRRDGEPLPGWPVRVPGWQAGDSNGISSGGIGPLAIGPDGTVYVGVNPVADTSRYEIHAFAPDGTKRKGWPERLPGGAQGFALAPDGIVVAWWYEGIVDGLGLQARRTRFTMLDRKGDPIPGWPIGSVGAASWPVIRADGGIVYTSATGKVWAHDRRGKIIDGWPYRLPYQIAPQLRRDGRLLFVAFSEVHVVDDRGRAVKGWPWRTPGSLEAPGCDLDSEGYPVYALDADDTLFVAPWKGSRTDVLALAPDGSPQPSWRPYRVPAGWRATNVDPAVDGTLTVGLTGGTCFQEYDATSVRLDSRGSLIGDAPGTPLSVVYDAMRPEGLRTADGGSSYSHGDEVGFRFELVDRAVTAVTLPLVDYFGSAYYAAGTIQTWLERLGPETDLDCFPKAARKDERYATGGWIAVSAVPVTIKPGGSLPSLFDVNLTSEQTACLPPGDYRFHVEYKPLGGDLEDVLADRSLEFAITDASASPRPTPTPIAPTPSPPPLTPSPSPVAT